MGVSLSDSLWETEGGATDDFTSPTIYNILNSETKGLNGADADKCK